MFKVHLTVTSSEIVGNHKEYFPFELHGLSDQILILLLQS